MRRPNSSSSTASRGGIPKSEPRQERSKRYHAGSGGPGKGTPASASTSPRMRPRSRPSPRFTFDEEDGWMDRISYTQSVDPEEVDLDKICEPRAPTNAPLPGHSPQWPLSSSLTPTRVQRPFRGAPFAALSGGRTHHPPPCLGETRLLSFSWFRPQQGLCSQHRGHWTMTARWIRFTTALAAALLTLAAVLPEMEMLRRQGGASYASAVDRVGSGNVGQGKQKITTDEGPPPAPVAKDGALPVAPLRVDAKNSLILPQLSVGEDAADVVQSHNFRTEGVASTMTEREILQSVLDRARQHRYSCDGADNNTTGVRNRRRTLPTPALQPFGIIDVIETYLTQVDGLDSGGSLHIISRGQECRLPPSRSCHVGNYTVFLYDQFEMSRSLFPPQQNSGVDGQGRRHEIMLRNRRLFIHALRSLSLPSASEIFLDYVGEMSDLEGDSQYGQRILAWDADRGHPVRLLNRHADGGGHELKMRLTPSPRARNEAMLFIPIDDQRVEYSAGGILAGFELWKRHSRSLIAAESDITPRAEDEDALFLDHCATDHDDLRMPSRRGPFFLHREYRCLLSHSVFAGLRDESGHAASIAPFINAVIPQVSGLAPRLFPPSIFKNRVVGGTLTNHGVPARGDGEEARRLLRTSATVVSSSLKDADDEVYEAIAGYFGSSPAQSVGWCASPSIRCTQPTRSEVVPWLVSSSPEFDSCVGE